MKNSGKVVYYFIIILLILCLIEFLSFLTIKYFNVDRNLFFINEFTERTEDQRLVTIKKNISIQYNNPDWTVITSNSRLRVSGLNEKIDKNSDDKKILILGDSVLFGYGLNYEKTIPHLLEKLTKYKVINGTIPSYALDQIVARFKEEFINLQNVDFVILYFINPANMYAHLGEKWVEDANWINKSYALLKEYNLPKLNLYAYGEPYTYLLIKKLIVRNIHELPSYKITKQSNKKYQTYIEKHLYQLNKILEQKNIKLILSPIIHPKFGQTDIEKKFVEAINLHNKSIISVAENFPNIELFYPKKIFENDQNTHFIDSIHFSEIGSKLYSSALSEFIKLYIN